MKRLLLPVLAAIALPTAVNAESYWLILLYNSKGTALEKIEMNSMRQCEQEAAKWMNKPTGLSRGKKAYQCLEGK